MDKQKEGEKIKEQGAKVTISQVAQAAGVSVATVSRVINQSADVRPDTFRHVTKIIEEMGYSPRGTLSSNRQGELIIAAVPSLMDGFYGPIIDGIQAASVRHGYSLLVHNGELTPEYFPAFKVLLSSTRSAGLISACYLAPELWAKLSGHIPIVQCHQYSEEYGGSFVAADDFSASQNAGEYALSTGRRKIAIISGPPLYQNTIRRRQGFLAAVESAGVTVPVGWQLSVPKTSFRLAMFSATQILSAAHRPNLIYATTDVYAAAVIKAASQLGLRVPEDIMVIGSDNTDISVSTSPSITTTNLPRFQMGYTACDVLAQQLSEPDTPSQHIYLGTELIIRNSTCLTQE
ncbi:LacI family DNA-binding transcriptional regulator [Oscillospiraceae bacterium MB08-C2-2]|nr:LacI family DNA-binding transcriptional regulator [Oscillospiraceae bacterium MB08-C2-2]